MTVKRSALNAATSPPIVVIGGATGSGKSALALSLAAQFSGTIINADSMQICEGLRVLTARPDAAAEAQVPHRLYGARDPATRCSAGRWRTLAVGEIDAAHGAGRLPLLTGGTGLYFKALLNGLAPVPDIPDAVRHDAAALFDEIGPQAFHARLAALDAESAVRLAPTNTQRVLRAYEVVIATGKALPDWQAVQAEAPEGYGRVAIKLVVWPERAALYAAINARVEAMAATGALEEAEAFMARGLSADVPAMKAVGLREFASHVAGEISLDEAVAAAQVATRRYAKRQLTWFRNQMPDATRLEGFGADVGAEAAAVLEAAPAPQAG